VAGQLILQATGFRQVVEQHQLAGLAVQRADGDGHATAIAQGNFVTIVGARGKAAGDHLAPEHAHQRLAEQRHRHRIGVAHDTLAIDHDDAAGQHVEQALQPVGQALLLGQLLHALRADQGKFTLQLGDAGFQQAVGLVELAGHLVEQREGLLQMGTALLLHRHLQWICSDLGSKFSLAIGGGHHAGFLIRPTA